MALSLWSHYRQNLQISCFIAKAFKHTTPPQVKTETLYLANAHLIVKFNLLSCGDLASFLIKDIVVGEGPSN